MRLTISFLRVIVLAILLGCCLLWGGVGRRSAEARQADRVGSLKPGEKVVLKGKTYFVEKIEYENGGRITLALPQSSSQSLGAFIVPVDATASDSQEGAGRTARKMIDGSGLSETYPGSGVYVHTSNVSADGSCMWNGAMGAVLQFDLGKLYNTSGFYIWNYNEGNGYNNRSVKEVEILASKDGGKFDSLGVFTLQMAPGKDDYRGETVPFKKPVAARYFQWKIRSNYRGGEMSGLAEVRFANAELKSAPPQTLPEWKPTYPRPQRPKIIPRQPLAGAENIDYPPDAGVIDVTRPPYNARGDGKTDDTAALQKALDDYPGRNAILYVPNGVYLISSTLRWGGTEAEQRNTTLQGQSREGTILQLKDSAFGFEDRHRPRGVLYTGHAPAQRFSNEICNLTVDTGIDNPGTCGIQFIANNQGGIYNVTIQSGDGQGIKGLDLGYTDEQGPCLIKNVRVLGFDYGVYVATSVDSETLEHITVAHQNVAGFRNDGQPCTVRDLRSLNAVPAFRADSGSSFLIDCAFVGEGKAKLQPALIVQSNATVRNLHTEGYRVAIELPGSKKNEIAGPNIPLFLSKPGVSLFGTPGNGLNLPIKETPEVVWETPKTWVGITQFGAKPDSEQDAGSALQQAIDSGATTVYLPHGSYRIGKTVVLRGNVRRLVGCKAYLIPVMPLSGQKAPVFQFADGKAPMVCLEGISTDFSSGPYFFMEHASARTLVMRRLAINFQAADAYHSTGTGDVYIEDVVGRYFLFHHQHLWARQFNPEGDGTHVLNDGGTAWILGLKTEGGGTLLETTNNGRSELLGSFSYSVGNTKLAPMFIIKDAQASLSFSEICFSGQPFPIIMQETQNGVTRTIEQGDPRWGSCFTLFSSQKRP